MQKILCFAPSAPSLREATFDVAQSKPHIFAKPDAGNPSGAFLGADPALGNVKTLCKLARGQELFRITPAFAVVRATAAGAALGQQPRRQERQERGDLVDRHASSPAHNRRIDPLLHHPGPGLAIDQTRLQSQQRQALKRNRDVLGRNLNTATHPPELVSGNKCGAGA
jgi:hypothetical protein